MSTTTTTTATTAQRFQTLRTQYPTDDQWIRSDNYHNSFLIAHDEALEFARKNTADNGLPDISVSPAEGKLLHLYAKTIGAKRILEVGTLGG